VVCPKHMLYHNMCTSSFNWIMIYTFLTVRQVCSMCKSLDRSIASSKLIWQVSEIFLGKIDTANLQGCMRRRTFKLWVGQQPSGR